MMDLRDLNPQAQDEPTGQPRGPELTSTFGWDRLCPAPRNPKY